MVLFKDAGHIIGSLLILLGVGMLLSLGVSLYYADGKHLAILAAWLLTTTVGFALRLLKHRSKIKINKRTGYFIAGVGWLVLTFFSAMPYIMTESIRTLTDAFFEASSGFTTTGATILKDIEVVSPSILFWRSYTQWIGGMGIIVLSVAILPLLGIGGVELFVAEAPGPTSDKIHPRIQETAKRLWLIYLGLTSVLAGLLYMLGMTGFDAINHSMTTLASGGFSTKNASIAHWDSAWIHYTIIPFMFMAGTNFTLLYFLFKGRFRHVWRSQEFRAYASGTFLLVGLVTVLLFMYRGTISEVAFREVLFQVVSIITTTGFVTADYTSWGLANTFVFFLLFFAGGSAGSTSGGVKVIRHLVFLKNTFLEFKRILHPRAMIRIKIDDNLVAPRVLTHVMVFILVYLAVFGIGTLLVTATGMDMVTSAGAVAACLGNVGPAIGGVGPMDNFSDLPSMAKWILSFLMIMGRLELFTFLVLFTPFYWRNN